MSNSFAVQLQDLIAKFLSNSTTALSSATLPTAGSSAATSIGTKPPVFVLLFGILRSTIPLLPLQSNVIAPLQDAGHNVTVLLHTFTACNHHSRFAATHHDAVANLRQVVPGVHVGYTPVCEAEAALQDTLQGCKAAGDAWNDSFTAYAKHVMALYSLQNVTAMLVDQFPGQSTNAIVMHTRPDTLLNCPLLAADLLGTVGQSDIAIPAVGSAASWGLNDRFALGRAQSMLALGLRLAFTEVKCSTVPVHAEKMLWLLAHEMNITAILRPDIQVRPCTLAYNTCMHLPERISMSLSQLLLSLLSLSWMSPYYTGAKCDCAAMNRVQVIAATVRLSRVQVVRVRRGGDVPQPDHWMASPGRRRCKDASGKHLDTLTFMAQARNATCELGMPRLVSLPEKHRLVLTVADCAS